MPDPSMALKRFDVALSFPGEYRTFVEAVAARLSAVLGKEHVLYDKYYEAEFARLNLNVYLPNLHRTQSELIVIFLCPSTSKSNGVNSSGGISAILLLRSTRVGSCYFAMATQEISLT